MTSALLPLFNRLGPAAHNNLRSALAAFFSWTVKQGLADRNPIVAIEPRELRARERVLTLPELKALLLATASDDDYSCIVRLLLYTGCRSNEIANLRWSEVFGDRIVLPAERVKNRRTHTLPITRQMRAVLDRHERQLGRDNVFGRFPGRPFTGWNKSKLQLDASMREAGAAVAPWRVHDLRRSAATYMGELGVAPHIVEAVLNHVSGHRRGVAGIYNRAKYEQPIRAALVQWNEFLTALEKGRKSVDGSVVKLRMKI
jgi:integrase